MSEPGKREASDHLAPVVKNIPRDPVISDWFTIEQLATDVFATLVYDIDPVHNDPEWAETSPWGGTIVQGAHLLSFVPSLLRSLGRGATSERSDELVYQALPRVRFISPLRVGHPARAKLTIRSLDDLHDSTIFTFEAKDHTRPILAAEIIFAHVQGNTASNTPLLHRTHLPGECRPDWRITRPPERLHAFEDFHTYFRSLGEWVGRPLGTTRWFAVEELTSTCFGCVTRASNEPWNVPDPESAHSLNVGALPFYQLSVLPGLTQDLGLPFATDEHQVLLNYGFDSVRWMSLPPWGKRMRSHVWLHGLQPRGDGYLGGLFHAVELENRDVPVMCATNLLLWLPTSGISVG